MRGEKTKQHFSKYKIFEGNKEIAEELLNHGANVHFRDSILATPLHRAVIHGLYTLATLNARNKLT